MPGISLEEMGHGIRLPAVTALLVAAVVLLSPELSMACGSSCECPSGQQCDSGAICQPVGTVFGSGTHPLCCSDPSCDQPGSVCENSDGSVGVCSAGGCVPTSCSAMGKDCDSAPDGCGGTVQCGQCPPGAVCQDGVCFSNCMPNCTGKQCGDDGCGGSCGECPPGWPCSAGFTCAPCQSSCAGKECGDDGCGGSCGNCPDGLACAGGVCSGCTPSCAGKECGDDGCGGSCGSCGFDAACNPQGQCACKPACLNKECGDDGCGGACGACGFDDTCSPAGICVPADEPKPDISAPDEDAGGTPATPDAGGTPAGDDAASTPGPETPGGCPFGYHLTAMGCVANTPVGEEEGGGSGGGCSVAGGEDTRGLLALFLLLVAVLACLAMRPPRWLVACLGLALIVTACAETQVVKGTGLPGWDVSPGADWTGGESEVGGNNNGCTPDCDGKECGKDNCGGLCGVCPETIACTDYVCAGQCENECSPPGSRMCVDAGFADCGQYDGDGCVEWSEVSYCPGAGVCVEGECECVANCQGKECGFDDCEGSCGTCPAGGTCSNYACTDGCVDECDTPGLGMCSGDGRVVCGQYDGDECLEWGDVLPCTGPCVDGECGCDADCSGKQCGGDGCGGVCGECPPGQTCKDYACATDGPTDCLPGEVDQVSCGACGTQERTCNSNGTWGPFSTCQGEGVCFPAETDTQSCGACGTQTRTCKVGCTWDNWGPCVGEGTCTPGQSDSATCGKCGLQTQSCDATCQWGGWGGCFGEGVCAPGEVQSQPCGLCGQETRLCNATCQWDSWSGCNGQGICTPGDNQSQPCGNCGTQTRSCNSSCMWSNWAGCAGQGACQPGASGECGACGWQTCSPACQWGPCTGEGECQPGQQSTTGCPTCRGKTCTNNCTWSAQCNQCVGCNSFTQCGMGCPSGYHATAYNCSFSCGSSCWSNNQSTCAPSCGGSFTKCGMGCPSGYHATNYNCSFSCGDSCWSNNQTTCQAD